MSYEGFSASARAWVNFNGTGTVAIRDSFNVSSITDRETGKFTANFATPMPNTNYCVVGAAGEEFVTLGVFVPYTPSTGSYQFSISSTTANVDTIYNNVVVFSS